MSRHRSAATVIAVLSALVPIAGCAPPGARHHAPVTAAETVSPADAGAVTRLEGVELDPRCEPPFTPIPEVQGTGPISPRRGERVTVQGVVTGDFQGGDALEGFFLQAAVGDGDPATSDAVFVHARPEVETGDLVRVEGEVKEFFERTELDDVDDLVICARGLPLFPEALAMPFAEGRDLEPLEGMLVRVPAALTVTDLFELGRFGQLQLVAGGRLVAATNGTSPADALPAERRLLIVDDGRNVERPVPVPYLRDGRPPRVGDAVRELAGVLTFSHGRWMLEPTAAPRFETANPRPATPPPVAGELRVAAMNLHNYFTTLGERGAATADELERQRRKLIAALVALDADVVGLTEVENGSPALDDLIAGIADGGGPRYAAAVDPPQGLGDDPIRVALIHRPDRLRPAGPARVATGGVLAPRHPLAQTYEVTSGTAAGERFTVIVAHFKSKGGCDDATGPDRDQGDGQGCWNDLRTRQARRMLAFVEELEQTSGDGDVLLVGDLNAYGAEDPIRALVAGGLIDELAAHVEPESRYSFVFRGAAGYLDHALTSTALHPRVTGAAVWHVNADEAPLLDYRESNPRSLYRPDPFRSSDHDPVLIGLTF